jgi:hypothetical protein
MGRIPCQFGRGAGPSGRAGERPVGIGTEWKRQVFLPITLQNWWKPSRNPIGQPAGPTGAEWVAALLRAVLHLLADVPRGGGFLRRPGVVFSPYEHPRPDSLHNVNHSYEHVKRMFDSLPEFNKLGCDILLLTRRPASGAFSYFLNHLQVEDS